MLFWSKVNFETSATMNRNETAGRSSNLSGAGSLCRAADALRAQGEYSTAETLYLQAMTVVRVAYGDRHPELAVISNNLAVLEGAATRPWVRPPRLW